MYWDVVEVKPLPNYCLSVRFADGLRGQVQLREEDFAQVFLDHGAVAWPGEIDLAPDAMYEEVAKQPIGAGRSR